MSKWEMNSYVQGDQNYCSICFQNVWIAGIGVIYHIIDYNMNTLDYLSILSCKVVYIGCMLCKMFDCEMHSLASFVTNIGNDHAFCFITAPNCLHQNPFGHGTESHVELNSFLKYDWFFFLSYFKMWAGIDLLCHNHQNCLNLWTTAHSALLQEFSLVSCLISYIFIIICPEMTRFH